MIIKDINQIPKIINVIDELNKKRVQIGILGDDSKEPSILMIATVQEYGVNITVTDKMRAFLHYQGLHLKDSTTEIKIPERSFIRAGWDTAKEDTQKVITKLLPSVLKLNMSVNDFYEIIGNYVVGKLHEYVDLISEPALHPFTIERKGSTHPLIDTGRLNQAITYQVVNN